MKPNLIKLLKISPVFIGLFFALLNMFHYAGETTLGADIVSRVLPAVAYKIGMGFPYTNYWEITPPGHYIVLDIWSIVFGFSPLSIKLLQLAVSLVLIIAIYFILKKVLNKYFLFISTILIYFFLFSTRFLTFVLPAELLALMFSSLGLLVLLYEINYKKAMFFSTFLFFFSGQIKDPFMFSTLAIIFCFLLRITLNTRLLFLIFRNIFTNIYIKTGKITE